jgi:hypothetical protein
VGADTKSTLTREAIASKGRSEAGKACRLADPPACVVVGRSGYLPAPPTLQRFARL